MFRKFIQVLRTTRKSSFRFTAVSLKTAANNQMVSGVGQFTVRRVCSTPFLLNKLYVDNENNAAYAMMSANHKYRLREDQFETIDLITREEYAVHLSKDWSQAKPDDLLSAFKQLSIYASQNNICISETIFDGFIDAFTDNIHHLSDEQLGETFWFLKKWPETENAHVRNFIEVWAALDDACLARMDGWTFQKMMKFADFCTLLNLTRKMEYIFKCLWRAHRQAKYLRPAELVQIMHYAGIKRSTSIKLFPFEERFQKVFEELSLQEISIISLGFFKTKTPIRNVSLINRITYKTAQDMDTLSDIALTGILKLIRYSYKTWNREAVERLMERLEERAPQSSLLCGVHIALLAQRSSICNYKLLNLIGDVFLKNPEIARLKDLERFALAFSSFDRNKLQSEEMFKRIIEELKKPERQGEILNHGRTFALCLHYLTTLIIPDPCLISKALDEDFLKLTYGRTPYTIDQEILALDKIAELEIADYTGNRLPEKSCKSITRRNAEYIPKVGEKFSLNVMEKMLLDVILLLQKMRGGEEYACGVHLLPHFRRADAVLANDAEGKPLKIPLTILNTFGKVLPKPTDDTWFALIITGKKGVDDLYSHYFKLKYRQLRIIGYNPILLSTNKWMALTSENDKMDYLNHNIYSQPKSDTNTIMKMEYQ